MPGRVDAIPVGKLLPKVKGQTLLIQTHQGEPIVNREILKRHFPGLPDGKLTGKIVQQGTTLVFVDVDSIASALSKE